MHNMHNCILSLHCCHGKINTAIFKSDATKTDYVLGIRSSPSLLLIYHDCNCSVYSIHCLKNAQKAVFRMSLLSSAYTGLLMPHRATTIFLLTNLDHDACFVIIGLYVNILFSTLYYKIIRYYCLFSLLLTSKLMTHV